MPWPEVMERRVAVAMATPNSQALPRPDRICDQHWISDFSVTQTYNRHIILFININNLIINDTVIITVVVIIRFAEAHMAYGI